MQVGETLQARVAEMRVPTGDGFWKSSISVGVAVRSEEMRDFDALIKLADAGVYQAKGAGRNCVRSAQTPPD
jgi:hemerythrin